VQFRRTRTKPWPRSSHCASWRASLGRSRIDLQETAAWRVVTRITREERDEHEERSLDRAVKKAEAQGARLILAQARQMQCGLFGSVSACREARTFSLQPGPGARRLVFARVADVMLEPMCRSHPPVPAGRDIFRRNGSEAGWPMCSTTSASYMKPKRPRHRRENGARAVAILRRTDDKRNMTTASGTLRRPTDQGICARDPTL